MKSLATIFFLLIFCAGSALAQQQRQEEKADVAQISVVSAHYLSGGDFALRKVQDDAPFIRETGNYSPVLPLPRDGVATSRQTESIKTEFSPSRTRVVLKNNAAKKITAVEYLFIVSDKDGKEIKRHRFVNESNINPGKTAAFSDQLIGYENKWEINFKAEIVRVKFADGNVWLP